MIEVSPKYSSQIGVVKYMRRYSMGSDSAASLVLARRGMGIYHEKLPARYAFQTSVHPEARQHVFAHWQCFNSYYLKVGFRNNAKIRNPVSLRNRVSGTLLAPQEFLTEQYCNSYYLKVGFRNNWFSPNLTGSTGDGLVNTVRTISAMVKRTNKALAQARESDSLYQVVEV